MNNQLYERILPSSRIPHVKECIKYIESCGYEYEYGYNGSYKFRKLSPTRPGMTEVYFTLQDLRHAFKNGW